MIVSYPGVQEPNIHLFKNQMLISSYFLPMFLLLVSLAAISSCTLAFQSAAPLSSCYNAAGRSRHREPSSSLAVFPGFEQIGQEGISGIGPEAVFDLSRLGLEGLGLEGLDLALALTSAAAAGAASQFPRISALEADRNRLKFELKEAKENLNAVSVIAKYLVYIFLRRHLLTTVQLQLATYVK